MVYKKYIKRGNKVFGPYLYESYRVGEKVKTRYVGYGKKPVAGKKFKLRGVNLFILIFLLCLVILFFWPKIQLGAVSVYNTITGQIARLTGMAINVVDIDSCRDLTDADTLYRLTADVTASGTCFTITENNITLEGQGKKITYASARKGNAVIVDPSKWHDWFSPTGEIPLVGDFNGDGYDDIVTFTQGPVGCNDGTGCPVWVALSNGRAFGASSVWKTGFSPTGEVPLVGDFNNDGKDDIATVLFGIFNTGQVYIALSTGSSFGAASVWYNGNFAQSGKVHVGDFNGDGLDDLVRFKQNTVFPSEVEVALSTGSGFSTKTIWNSWFSPAPEIPHVGDFNGDGLDDIVTFVPSTEEVYVGISDGTQFVSSQWKTGYTLVDRVPMTGDFNGDGLDDIIKFRQDVGYVYVTLSNGTAFLSTKIWNIGFSSTGEIPHVGDFNNDGYDDIVTFTQGSNADVHVLLSNGNFFKPKESKLVIVKNLIIEQDSSAQSNSIAIHYKSSDNGTIENNVVTTYGMESHGVISDGRSSEILNNEITTYGNDIFGILLSANKNSKISDNKITIQPTGICCAAIFSSDAENTVFSNNEINVFKAATYGYYFTDGNNNALKNENVLAKYDPALLVDYSSNLTVKDSILNATDPNINDIWFDLQSSGTVNFTNVTFDSVGFNSGSTAQLNVKWWLELQINDLTGLPIEGATVKIFNLSEELFFTDSTDIQGRFRQGLTEYIKDATGTTYYQDYIVNISKTGYITESKEISMTTNQFVLFTLSSIEILPVFSNYKENPLNGTEYQKDRLYEFNVTVTDNNLDSVWIEFDDKIYNFPKGSTILTGFVVGRAITGRVVGQPTPQPTPCPNTCNAYLFGDPNDGPPGKPGDSWDTRGRFVASPSPGHCEYESHVCADNDGDDGIPGQDITCGALCDSSEDCFCPSDECQGLDWYDYPEFGTCNLDTTLSTGCTCDFSVGSGGACEPSITYNDPKCAVAEYCGDGIVNQVWEECDDGNRNNNDACTNGCKNAICGDGYLWTGIEECDDGNNFDCDGCKGDCSQSDNVCGDGVMECDERCDPHHKTCMSGESCLVHSDCAIGFCSFWGGNCGDDCRVAVSPDCGNNIVEPELGEECDPPESSSSYCDGATCNLDCTCYSALESINYTFRIRDLSAGVHNYTWFANDTDGNINSSGIRYYTIKKANPNIAMTIEPPPEQRIYGDAITVTCTSDSPELVNLYRDGEYVTNENGQAVILGAGIYGYECNVSESQNYTNGSVNQGVLINPRQATITLKLNDVEDNLTVTYPQSVNVSASSDYGEVMLFKDDIDFTAYNSEYIIHGGGFWKFNATLRDKQNYTFEEKIYYLNVTPRKNYLSLESENGWNINYNPYQLLTKINCISETGAPTPNFDKDKITITSPYSEILAANDTGYNFSCYSEGNQNYSAEINTSLLIVNKIGMPILLTINGDENNKTVDYGATTVIDASKDYEEGSLRLYENSQEIFSWPYTVMKGAREYKYELYFDETQNFTQNYTSLTLNVTPTEGKVELYINGTRNNRTFYLAQYVNISAILINGTGNIQVYINESIIYNGSSPSENITFLDIGNYNITAVYLGNQNYTADNETWKVIVTDEDIFAPAIVLISPADEAEIVSQNPPVHVGFSFNVSDYNEIANCSLYVNGNFVASNQTYVNKSETNIIEKDYGQGTYSWYINCTDVYGNQGNSSVWSFTVTVVSDGDGDGDGDGNGNGCTRNWNCTGWSECISWNQTRVCEDLANCQGSRYKNETRVCDCTENWLCDWTVCSPKNWTYPFNCVDLSECGTENNKPLKEQCEYSPDIPPKGCRTECGDWQECEINYKLDDLIKGIIIKKGERKRLCVIEGESNCKGAFEETESCEIKTDIYTKEKEWCYQKYLELYNEETNELITRIRADKTTYARALYIYFSLPKESVYCDYCYDGIKDFDETAVDCGGESCPDCLEPYRKGIDILKLLKWLMWFIWLLLAAYLAYLIYNLFRKPKPVKEKKKKVYLPAEKEEALP